MLKKPHIKGLLLRIQSCLEQRRPDLQFNIKTVDGVVHMVKVALGLQGYKVIDDTDDYDSDFIKTLGMWQASSASYKHMCDPNNIHNCGPIDLIIGSKVIEAIASELDIDSGTIEELEGTAAYTTTSPKNNTDILINKTDETNNNQYPDQAHMIGPENPYDKLSAQAKKLVDEHTSHETVDLSGQHIDNMLWLEIIKILSTKNDITHLDLSNNDLTYLGPEIAQMKQIESLSIYKNNGINMTVTPDLLTILPCLKKLECDANAYESLHKANINEFLEKGHIRLAPIRKIKK